MNTGNSWDDSFVNDQPNGQQIIQLNQLNNNSPHQIYENTHQKHRTNKLDYRPSTRTVSSGDSCYSDRYVSSDDDNSAEDDLDIGHELDDEFNCSIDQNENSLNSSVNSDKSSTLRQTLSKARYHLSFDKWKNHNQNHSISHLSSGGVGGSGGNNNNNIVYSPNNSNTMPATTATPSTSSPNTTNESFSRLSRWFSIRRGSVNQYDMRGVNGIEKEHNRRNSIDHVDLSSLPPPNKVGSVGKKMSKLLESEEDPLAYAIEGFNMTRNNGTLEKAQLERRQNPPELPPPPLNLSPQQQKRRHIVAAIVHSENNYVAALQRLVNGYKKPLEESNPPILNHSKIGTLFHRLPEILQLHTLFRIALADYVRNWDKDERIGDVFVASFSKSIVLEVYSNFINNFSIAMDLARSEAKRKSALADFLKVKQISAHDRLSFFGLMVKPVQRFPQFILFLQDLLKHTPQGHHDRMSLQLALTQLESLAEMLNERKREAEQYQAFREMLAQISGSFNIRSLLPTSAGSSANNTPDITNRNRYLLREDNVTQLEFNQSGLLVKSKKRRLLLLNDKVVCVSVAPKQSSDFGATEKLTFKWMYPVQDVEILDNNQSTTLSRILTAGMLSVTNRRSNVIIKKFILNILSYKFIEKSRFFF